MAGERMVRWPPSPRMFTGGSSEPQYHHRLILGSSWQGPRGRVRPDCRRYRNLAGSALTMSDAGGATVILADQTQVT